MLNCIVTSVPSVTNVYYFFMNCRDAGRFVRAVSLRHCLLWCRELSMLPRTRAAALSLCRRAFVYFRAPMVPRTHGAARGTTVVVFVCVFRALLHAAAQFPVLPRTRGAARSRRYVVLACVSAHLKWCRSVLRAAASHAAAEFLRAAACHAAAQFYVLPRPMLPRSSTCFRVPCCRAVLCVAASPGAAPCSMLPR